MLSLSSPLISFRAPMRDNDAEFEKDYSCECMDFANVLNEWLTKAGKDIYDGVLEAIEMAEADSEPWRIGARGREE